MSIRMPKAIPIAANIFWRFYSLFYYHNISTGAVGRRGRTCALRGFVITMTMTSLNSPFSAPPVEAGLIDNLN